MGVALKSPLKKKKKELYIINIHDYVRPKLDESVSCEPTESTDFPKMKAVWGTLNSQGLRVAWWLSALRIQCCHELRCRLQMWLRPSIAVAVA